MIYKFNPIMRKIMSNYDRFYYSIENYDLTEEVNKEYIKQKDE